VRDTGREDHGPRWRGWACSGEVETSMTVWTAAGSGPVSSPEPHQIPGSAERRFERTVESQAGLTDGAPSGAISRSKNAAKSSLRS
jgi:hypothetical protein